MCEWDAVLAKEMINGRMRAHGYILILVVGLMLQLNQARGGLSTTTLAETSIRFPSASG